MRRTLISAAVGVLLACGAFWLWSAVDTINRAAALADLQGQTADQWLSVSPMVIADGSNAPGHVVEPLVTWTIEAKRTLELRLAVSNRDMDGGDPVCIGGTVTFILQPSVPATFTRPLSRIAGVDRCDWPVGQYRSRVTWTMTDPESRVSKTLFQESAIFSVTP